VSLPYVVRPQAETEIVEAALRYERQRPGLGTAFFAAIRDTMLRAAEAPSSCAQVRGVEMPIRCLSARRFPYRVVFLHEADLVVFIAVAHKRRRPGYWQDRV
jgi:hypothetical protein